MSYGLITPEQLRLRLDIGETPVMIDVRQPEEHQEIHIPNSILIPLDTLPSRIEELEHFILGTSETVNEKLEEIER